MREIIGLILGALALYVLSIAAILTILPVFAAIILFFAALPFWISRKLRTDRRVRDAVDLGVALPDIHFRFDVSWPKPLWPCIPLVVATAGSLLVFAVRYPRLGPEYLSDNPYYWYPEMVASIAITGLGPPFAGALFKNYLNRFLGWATAHYLNVKFSGAKFLLGSIVAAEGKLRDQYEAIGVHLSSTASETSREFLLDHVTGSRAKIRAELAEHLEELQMASAEMQKCAALREDVQAAFEHAKTAVIQKGSPTLLTELDRILHGLESDMLGDLFAQHKWDEVQEVFRLMISELDTIRSAAGRGEAEPAPEFPDGADQVPQSLEDAYRILNVHPGARKEAIKKVVDSQRLIWHTDVISDPAERERRKARIQCINAAWDIINGRRAVS